MKMVKGMEVNNFIGVGGLVLHQGQYLLVKQAFGEYKGLWILPGGHVKSGEALHRAAEREVWEESRIRAEATDVIAVRSRIRGPETTDCYIVFMMRYLEGSPIPDQREALAASFLDFKTIEQCESVVNLTRILIEQHSSGRLNQLSRAYAYDFYNANEHDYQLFL